MRKLLIAANWKMYKTLAEAKSFVDAFLPLVKGHTRDEIALFLAKAALAAGFRQSRLRFVSSECASISFPLSRPGELFTWSWHRRSAPWTSLTA